MKISGKPVIAAINGFALGGAAEDGDGMHHQDRSGARQVRAAEVSWWLLPGGGGTQRLPR